MASTNDSPDLLLDRLKKNAKIFPSKKAAIFLSNGSDGGKEGLCLTYGALEKETNNMAQRLVDLGVEKGDRVVLVYPPSLDFMVAFLACLKAGIVAVPVFPPNPARKDTVLMFSGIVERSGARVVLTSVSYNHLKKLAGLKDVFKRLTRTNNIWPEDLQWVVTNGESTSSNIGKSWSSESTANASDLAFLQYTSGSTSEPKGVMITHGNLAHNLSIITKDLKATDDTVVVSWLPQYHDMGLIGSYLGVLYCGGSGYYMSPLSFLQRPMMWMEAVSKHRATHLQAPNFAFKLTARKFNPSDYSASTLNLSSVRHIINAAEPVDEESIVSFEKAFVPFGLRDDVMFPTYGLAEHTVFVCSGGKQRLTVAKKELEVDGKVVLKHKSAAPGEGESAATTRLVGCGYPSRQGVDVRIVNPDSLAQVDDGIVGEIWVQSPSKAVGYFGKEEETKDDFFAHLSDSPTGSVGFLRTGDLGFFQNSELFICGRLKDLIIIGGRNYYPQDIESTVEASCDQVRPGCSAAFTIDLSCEGGEEVAVVTELRDVPKGKTVNEICTPLAESIRAAINQEHSLGIAHICFLGPRTVPKTTSGKIARAWCRKAFVANTLEVVYRKSFKRNVSFEIEQTSKPKPAAAKRSSLQVAKVRAMAKKDLLAQLTHDLSKMASLPPEAIKKNEALVIMLDSMSISQFKGLLESEYGTKLSDEYLFRETTTVQKLVDIVKLGYAPDDDEVSGGGVASIPTSTSSPGATDGLAGKLGCPPGVKVCCVVM